MDVVTLGQAKTQGDKRYQPRPTGQSQVSGGAPGTRRATLVLSSPSSVRATAALDWLQRTILMTPATTTRWRLKVANRQLSTVNQALTSPMTVSAVYVGTPVYASTGRWTGDFTSTPSAALTTLTVPTDGSDVVSPWVNTAGLQFQRNQPLMISYGVSCPSSGTGVAQAQGGQTCAVVGGGSALAGNTSIASNSPLIGEGFSLLDVRIEVEFVGSNGIIYVITDSTGEGVSDGDVTATQKGAGPTERWPELSGLLAGNFVTNLGIGGSQAVGVWATSTNYCYTRVDWATCQPDAIIEGLGINDVHNAVTFSGFQTAVATIKSIVAGLAPNAPVWRTTILPGIAPSNGGTLVTGISSGATSLSSTLSVAATKNLLIGVGSLEEDLLVGAGGPTGSGPFTIPTNACAHAHVAGEPITSGAELTRQQDNEWLRQVPLGYAGVFDFDALMVASTGVNIMDPRWVSQDGIHPFRAGYQRLAREARLNLH